MGQYQFVNRYDIDVFYPARDSIGDGVLFSIDFFVCLFISQQDYDKTAWPICNKLLPRNALKCIYAVLGSHIVRLSVCPSVRL